MVPGLAVRRRSGSRDGDPERGGESPRYAGLRVRPMSWRQTLPLRRARRHHFVPWGITSRPRTALRAPTASHRAIRHHFAPRRHLQTGTFRSRNDAGGHGVRRASPRSASPASLIVLPDPLARLAEVRLRLLGPPYLNGDLAPLFGEQPVG